MAITVPTERLRSSGGSPAPARLGIDHITHIPSRETQVRLLNGVFRVRDGSEHPVRDAGEVGAVPLEFRLAGRHLVLRPAV